LACPATSISNFKHVEFADAAIFADPSATADHRAFSAISAAMRLLALARPRTAHPGTMIDASAADSVLSSFTALATCSLE